MYKQRFAVGVLILNGLVLIGIGLGGLVAPGLLLDPVGITLNRVGPLNEIRAGYGGMHLGVGLFILWMASRPSQRRTGLTLAVLFMGGLVLGRVLSLAIDGWPPRLLFSLLAGELVLGGLAFAALKVGRESA